MIIIHTSAGQCSFESFRDKPCFRGLSTRSDTNRAVQSQKMARGSKFRIKKGEGLYYICSDNKGADQLRGYRAADLRLCFRLYAKKGFIMTQLISRNLLRSNVHDEFSIITS